jgi:ribonuclease-3
MNNYEEIEAKLGIVFKDKTLLDNALTHRSYLNEHREIALQNNERIEFLGDAVLELLISTYLYSKYPEKPEGELTNIRAAVVRTESLAEESRNLGLGEHLRMSKGEKESGGRDKDYLLANTFEAYIGAAYLDQGYEAAQKFITENLLPHTKEIVSKKLWRDAKSLIQEKSQEYLNVTPSYKVISEVGPDHDKNFTVGIFLEQK